jgi:hypothetical protein
MSPKSDSHYEKFNCLIVKVQCLTFVFGVTEILDLNVGPETALMIRGLSKQMASGLLHTLRVIPSSFLPLLLNRG